MKTLVRAIALYLPQFHPIPENDEWWGKGFTEWTNVAKARPLFKNHFQPHLPADLGFYDLRVEENRIEQAKLAASYGVHGFCYWHYWFAGRRIIERPFQEMVLSSKPDYPFCVAWANQTWTGTWHGLANKKTLIEQTYPGKKDFQEHFYALLSAFLDPRYIEVDQKKLFFVFRPNEIPESAGFTDFWQELAMKEGFKGFHFVGMHMPPDWDPYAHGYQASVESGPMLHTLKKTGIMDKIAHRLLHTDTDRIRQRAFNIPKIVSYKKYVEQYPDHQLSPHEYPMIYPGWDNTPRSGSEGWLFENSSPALFETICSKAFTQTNNKKESEKIVILKSWNEWAEGNYLEPDMRWGHSYLKAFCQALEKFKN